MHADLAQKIEAPARQKPRFQTASGQRRFAKTAKAAAILPFIRDTAPGDGCERQACTPLADHREGSLFLCSGRILCVPGRALCASHPFGFASGDVAQDGPGLAGLRFARHARHRSWIAVYWDSSWNTAVAALRIERAVHVVGTQEQGRTACWHGEHRTSAHRVGRKTRRASAMSLSERDQASGRILVGPWNVRGITRSACPQCDPRGRAEIWVFRWHRFLCRAVSPDHSGHTISLKDIQKARRTRRHALRQGFGPEPGL
jgi:hypothetical protein